MTHDAIMFMLFIVFAGVGILLILLFALLTLISYEKDILQLFFKQYSIKHKQKVEEGKYRESVALKQQPDDGDSSQQDIVIASEKRYSLEQKNSSPRSWRVFSITKERRGDQEECLGLSLSRRSVNPIRYVFFYNYFRKQTC